jgi:hypothetical protein
MQLYKMYIVVTTMEIIQKFTKGSDEISLKHRIRQKFERMICFDNEGHAKQIKLQACKMSSEQLQNAHQTLRFDKNKKATPSDFPYKYINKLISKKKTTTRTSSIPSSVGQKKV